MQTDHKRGSGRSSNGGFGEAPMAEPPTAKPFKDFIRFWGLFPFKFTFQLQLGTASLASCVCYIYQNFECVYTPVLVILTVSIELFGCVQYYPHRSGKLAHWNHRISYERVISQNLRYLYLFNRHNHWGACIDTYTFGISTPVTDWK